MKDKKPNVLLFFTDQQRADTIAALGNSIIETPNLDRLCMEGAAFTSAYTPSPVCVPARCSMMYGQYPCRTRCYENDGAMPEDGRPSIMDVLSAAGYRTHGIGKCHFTRDWRALRGFQSREMQEEGRKQGPHDYYDFLAEHGLDWVGRPNGLRNEMYYVPQPSPVPDWAHPTRWVGDRSISFVQEAANGDEPWFLFSSFIHPHPPFAPPASWIDRYPALSMPLPRMPESPEQFMTWVNRKQNRYKYRDQGIDRNLVRIIKAYYYACISHVDEQVGRVLSVLESTGQMDNTLILFTSDHGEHLGDYDCFGKRSMHDTAARVPFVAHYPGRFSGGRTCDVPVNLVDVAPTIFGAAGLDHGGMETDGEDVADILSGACKRDMVFSQHHRQQYGQYMGVSTDWKYFYSAPDDKEFLFDRTNDREEMHNLAGEPAAAEPRSLMRRRVIEQLRACGEDRAVDGDDWRRYPHQEVPTMPVPEPKSGRLAQGLPVP